jgi:hypothetical protein
MQPQDSITVAPMFITFYEAEGLRPHYSWATWRRWAREGTVESKIVNGRRMLSLESVTKTIVSGTHRRPARKNYS